MANDSFRRISEFPLGKPFERQPATTSLSHSVFRLVVGLYDSEPFIIGTATLISGHLLVTNKHVIKEILRRENRDIHDQPEIKRSLKALQITDTHEYRLWNVAVGWACPQTDIAFLQLSAKPEYSGDDPTTEFQHPIIRAFPPPVGSIVAAFGYRKSLIEVSQTENGERHFDITDEPMMAVGVIREIHENRRDLSLMNFPCFQVSARFDAGMSGGPVFDESGAMCGIVSLGMEGSHMTGEPISYACTLWPMFATNISAKRAGDCERDAPYPAYELARDGQIGVIDLERLNQAFALLERNRRKGETA